MTTDKQAYLHALYPLEHLSDEDIAEQLDKQIKRSKAARKGRETRKKQQTEDKK